MFMSGTSVRTYISTEYMRYWVPGMLTWLKESKKQPQSGENPWQNFLYINFHQFPLVHKRSDQSNCYMSPATSLWGYVLSRQMCASLVFLGYIILELMNLQVTIRIWFFWLSLSFFFKKPSIHVFPNQWRTNLQNRVLEEEVWQVL